MANEVTVKFEGGYHAGRSGITAHVSKKHIGSGIRSTASLEVSQTDTSSSKPLELHRFARQIVNAIYRHVVSSHEGEKTRVALVVGLGESTHAFLAGHMSACMHADNSQGGEGSYEVTLVHLNTKIERVEPILRGGPMNEDAEADLAATRRLTSEALPEMTAVAPAPPSDAVVGSRIRSDDS